MNALRARVVVAAVIACCLAVVGAYLLLAPGPSDAAQMRSAVGRYWTAREQVWPPELREGSSRRLPASSRARMREEQVRVFREVTTGRLAEWGESFDPGEFLEESMSSGCVVTESNHEILSMSKPMLISPGVATVECRIRSWSEEWVVDAAGRPLGSSRADNACLYRYTFRREHGVWRIESEDLLTSPV